MNKYLIITFVALVLVFVLIKFKTKGQTVEIQRKDKKNVNNIIIGDSQCLFIGLNSKKYKIAKKEVLYKGGTGMSWLIGQLEKYPIDKTVDNVCISVGTNGAFNKYDNVGKLFELLHTKFPNADFYTVKGSWGWGGNKNITESQVNKYYEAFKPYSIIISTPIGYGEPHDQNKPSYKKIGEELDKYLN